MPANSPTSFRVSQTDLRLLDRIAFEHQLADRSAALRLALKGYQEAHIPAPIHPAIIPLADFNEFIKQLKALSEALEPAIRHAHVRDLPDQTPHRAAEIEKCHSVASKAYEDLARMMEQLRLVRFGVLACKELNVEKLRAAERSLEAWTNQVGKTLADPTTRPDLLEVCDREIQLYNELRSFLHACGLKYDPPWVAGCPT